MQCRHPSTPPHPQGRVYPTSTFLVWVSYQLDTPTIHQQMYPGQLLNWLLQHKRAALLLRALFLRRDADTQQRKRAIPTHNLFFFCHYPEFMTIAEGWNLNWQIGSFTFRLSAIFIKKVQYSTICLSISYSILPSVMNKTPRYLNALTWDSHLLPTQRGHYIIFRVPWPQAWRCWLSSHPLHIGLQTTLEVTAQWSQQDYIICKQKGWNEFTKMVDTLHFPATP